MKKTTYPFFFLLLLSGCGIYQSEFECKPGKGVGCTSATEVIKMIVEQEEENLFLPNCRRVE